MKLFQDKEFKYVGYEDGYHVFNSVKDNMEVRIDEAKYRVDNSTYICKRTGEMELTFATRRRLQRCVNGSL